MPSGLDAVEDAQRRALLEPPRWLGVRIAGCRGESLEQAVPEWACRVVSLTHRGIEPQRLAHGLPGKGNVALLGSSALRRQSASQVPVPKGGASVHRGHQRAPHLAQNLDGERQLLHEGRRVARSCCGRVVLELEKLPP